jgi:hypothetical protein
MTIEELYLNMETELLINIAKKLKLKKSFFKEVDKVQIMDWQLERLQQLDGLTQENIKIVSKYSGKTIKEVETLFNRALKTDLKDTELKISEGIKAGVLKEAPKESLAIKNALYQAQRTILSTLNEVNKSMIASAGEEYKDIINKVSTKVVSGTSTFTQAVKTATRELTDKGITGFTASNGAKWSTEAQTRMVVNAERKAFVNQATETRIIESGGNYVEINAYMGARPKCAEDQGKVYSLNGDTTPIKDLYGNTIRVYSWFDTSYGEPDGILGINCGHSRTIFVPQISVKEKVKINQKESDKIYEQSQEQRYLERQIRASKRELRMFEQMGSDELIKEAKSDLREKQANMRAFINKTDRTRRPDREFI